MKSGVLRDLVTGMAFNISFFMCVHMFICKIYKVIMHRSTGRIKLQRRAAKRNLYLV